MLNSQLNQKNLATKLLGRIIKYYPKLDSTNTKAWELISENAIYGTIVITDDQTKGRGRQSNKWFSVSDKSLTFSIILYPKTALNTLNKYPLIAGLAVTDCLSEYSIYAQLKWPNDILIKGKKVGGILCESKLSKNKINSLVIGIGLNINESITDFPQELYKSATSLQIESGDQLQIEQILTSILKHLEIRLNQIGETEKIISDWDKRCIHLLRTISFRDKNSEYKGIFRGLSKQGQAIISIDDKELKFDSGEISQIDFNE